jgi:stearoyl-CoA desaturase (delta-9 desaturase)
VNTVAHLSGSRSYATADSSRNNFVLGYLAMGDGWHNNHHHFPHAAQAGIRWYEADRAFRIIRLLEWLGIVWGVRRIPANALEQLAAAPAGVEVA